MIFYRQNSLRRQFAGLGAFLATLPACLVLAAAWASTPSVSAQSSALSQSTLPQSTASANQNVSAGYRWESDSVETDKKPQTQQRLVQQPPLDDIFGPPAVPKQTGDTRPSIGPIRPGFGEQPLKQTPIAASSSTSAPSHFVRKLPSEGTQVSVPEDLEELLYEGGTPGSLETLRIMERQQRLVAELAAKCTVSIRIGAAQGCGVLISNKGYIFTAAHVAIRPGKTAIVTLSDGRRVTATTLGMNRSVDAGMLRIDPDQGDGTPWPYASLGKSKNLEPGMWCIAMGHPGGYDAARGAVVRVGRLLEVSRDVIRTDCALIGGDSGGPLFNLAGELIAVHSRIGNDVADNLHVPIDHYDTSWEGMLKGKAWGYLPNFKPTLGVSGKGSDLTALISQVAPGSPADKAGIQVGDVILEFGEKELTDFASLKEAVDDTMPGERVLIVLRRQNQIIRMTVEIGRSGD